MVAMVVLVLAATVGSVATARWAAKQLGACGKTARQEQEEGTGETRKHTQPFTYLFKAALYLLIKLYFFRLEPILSTSSEHILQGCLYRAEEP